MDVRADHVVNACDAAQLGRSRCRIGIVKPDVPPQPAGLMTVQIAMDQAKSAVLDPDIFKRRFGPSHINRAGCGKPAKADIRYRELAIVDVGGCERPGRHTIRGAVFVAIPIRVFDIGHIEAQPHVQTIGDVVVCLQTRRRCPGRTSRSACYAARPRKYLGVVGIQQIARHAEPLRTINDDVAFGTVDVGVFDDDAGLRAGLIPDAAQAVGQTAMAGQKTFGRNTVMRLDADPGVNAEHVVPDDRRIAVGQVDKIVAIVRRGLSAGTVHDALDIGRFIFSKSSGLSE